eukprot:TRINITY_DN12062_c0_g1_i1.p2 TRINITY_DN12062_c0_g1~~TRINITY_DN12062_c0_g1_i1.p2  ORF type:complete len:137 (-),score=29.19 TRINITY_DN12062_c0_g1_i1:749-1159(-)
MCIRDRSGSEQWRVLGLIDRFVRNPSPTLRPFWNVEGAHEHEKAFLQASKATLLRLLRKLGLGLMEAGPKVWLVHAEGGALSGDEYLQIRASLESSLDDSGWFDCSQLAKDVLRGAQQVLPRCACDIGRCWLGFQI